VTSKNRKLTTANYLLPTDHPLEMLEQLIISGNARVLCIQGESGVGKTRLANSVVASSIEEFTHIARVYLPPEGLLLSVDDLLLSSLINQLFPVTPRGLTSAGLLDEFFNSICSQKTLCLIDNAESLPKRWLSDFITRWLMAGGQSALIITIPTAPTPKMPDVIDIEVSYAIYTLSGLSQADEHLIIELLGRDLASRFPKEELLAVANRVHNIPQRLLYLRWLAPRTLGALSEIAIDLSLDPEMPDFVTQAILRSNSPLVPFLALGRVRSVRFEEGLLASLWDRLGGGSVQGYISSRDRLLDLGILSRADGSPGTIQINPAVHVHLEKYITRELAQEQLAQIEYHIGEYYKGRFLNSESMLDANALEEFLYHSARARNIEAATRFVIARGSIERLRRDGQALGVRRVLATARRELQTTIEGEAAREVIECRETLLDIVDLEMAHVLSDLSEYEQALATLARAAAGSAASGDSVEAAQFREMVAFRRGVCLGDSGELQKAVLSYLGLVEQCMLSGRVTKISVEALGYAAMILGFLQEQAARPLGALSVDLAERLHSARLIVRNCCSFAQLLSYMDSADEAKDFLAHAEASIDSAGNRLDRRELGRVMVAKVSTYLAIGDLKNAKKAVEQASSLNGQLGDRRRLARAEALSGVIAFRERRLVEAKAISADALSALMRVGDTLNALICCFNLACFEGMAPAEAVATVTAQEMLPSNSWAVALKELSAKRYATEIIGNFWFKNYRSSILGLGLDQAGKADQC